MAIENKGNRHITYAKANRRRKEAANNPREIKIVEDKLNKDKIAT